MKHLPTRRQNLLFSASEASVSALERFGFDEYRTVRALEAEEEKKEETMETSLVRTVQSLSQVGLPHP